MLTTFLVSPPVAERVVEVDGQRAGEPNDPSDSCPPRELVVQREADTKKSKNKEGEERAELSQARPSQQTCVSHRDHLIDGMTSAAAAGCCTSGTKSGSAPQPGQPNISITPRAAVYHLVRVPNPYPFNVAPVNFAL